MRLPSPKHALRTLQAKLLTLKYRGGVCVYNDGWFWTVHEIRWTKKGWHVTSYAPGRRPGRATGTCYFRSGRVYLEQ